MISFRVGNSAVILEERVEENNEQQFGRFVPG